ncbi:hypothetical protein B0T20DRAFT_465058 [Sordaria brevicollis]|uniref:Uncharacterized protein n=1 Tax=Sordaria brevicollis TaxID=83679 RepID=A0AAE0NV88_SORBR|nr:hypothetical protein B0T20DRAFT_465058 [Sordaria brevicollis]
MLPPISPSSGFHWHHPGGVDSTFSYLNQPLEDELARDPSVAYLEPVPDPPQGEPPLIPLHYPFKGIHQECPPLNFAQDPDDEEDPDDKDWMDNRPADCYSNQEFNDRKEDATEEIKREWPLDHLTYVSYPMRAPDVLRHGWVNPESNAYLRPGTKNYQGPVINKNECGPDGIRLLFVSWLKSYSIDAATGVSVGLWRTHGTGELVVVKRIKGYWQSDLIYSPRTTLFHRRGPNVPQEQVGGPFPPGEIRFMDLPDNRTQRVTRGGFRFPWNPLMTCFPQTHAYQIHDYPSDMQNITHFGKFYNGGTVEGVIARYKDLKKPVPEPFIWHVIAQVGRAFKYMHTGRTMPDKTQPRGSLRGPPPQGDQEDEWNRQEDERARTWTKVSHYDAHQANIWLHFPTEHEREHDAAAEAHCLAHFDENFPQVILGDFGVAFNEHDRNHVRRRWGLDACPDMPDYETWRDKAEFGLTLVHLLLAGLGFEEVPMFNHRQHPTDWDDRHARYLRREARYSGELIDVVRRFRHVAYMCDLSRFAERAEHFFDNRVAYEYRRWKEDGWNLSLAPNSAWFHNTMIDIADYHVNAERTRLAQAAQARIRLANAAQPPQNNPNNPNNAAQNPQNNLALLLLHNRNQAAQPPPPHGHGAPPTLHSTLHQRIATMPYLIKSRLKHSQWGPHPIHNRYAIPVPGRATFRSKARSLYLRKLRRPITAAFHQHPPDPMAEMDKDKLWVQRTYRMERVRYKRPRRIEVEREWKGD